MCLCSVNPETRKREFHLLPQWGEVALGSFLYPLMQKRGGGVVHLTDRDYGKYVGLVQRVGKNLQQYSHLDLPFEFCVLRSCSHNAWCLPGGKIAINLGLLGALERESSSDRSFEELVAAVLSHEMTHASARHASRKMGLQLIVALIVMLALYVLEACLKVLSKKDSSSRTYRLGERKVEKLNFLSTYFIDIIKALLGLCQSRSHELEADRYGMYLMNRVGYDPSAAIHLQEFFQKQGGKRSSGVISCLLGLFSTHPSSEERIACNKQTLEKLLS